MNKTEPENNPPLGLDIGTSRIVVARVAERKYEYEAQLNAFVTLPNTRLVASLLSQENVFHEVLGADIIVAGNDAQRFAQMFHVETRRPMLDGVLNPKEPHSLAVVRRIITKLVGRAGTEGQKIFFGVPAPGMDGAGSIAYHQASCRMILNELGYDATPIEEGLAVVFGELGSANYSGIGISCGSGLCNVCLALLSIPVISFSIPKAGDFIDAQVALATGERATRLRVHKEQTFHLNGLSSDRVQNAYTVYYEEMVVSLVKALQASLSSAKHLPKVERAMPLAISGGSAMPQGFLSLFERTLRAHELPIQLASVQISQDPLNSTARGALMAALC